MTYTNTYNATDIDDIIVDGSSMFIAQLIGFASIFAIITLLYIIAHLWKSYRGD